MSKARDDPELAGRLAAVPPPPPREATARMDGDHMLITWKPGAAATGRVQYRVMRGRDRAPRSPAEGTAVVTRTERTDVTDAEAPPGARTVLQRLRRAWRRHVVPARQRAAGRPSPRRSPTCRSAAGDTSVAATWRAHSGADRVIVVRREDDPPRGWDDGTAVEASLGGFTDTGLRTGTEYYYRISDVLPDAGRPAPLLARRHHRGRCPNPPPRPVADLHVTGPGDGDAVMVATWTPPPYGRVRLMRSDEPLPWPAGTRVTRGRHGRR